MPLARSQYLLWRASRASRRTAIGERGCQAARRWPISLTRTTDFHPAVVSRRGGTVPTSQPGVSWPHETHLSERRPCSKCRSESCPLRPHMNCLAPIDTRLMIPPSGDDATGRFCVECVAISRAPSFRPLNTDFVRASGHPDNLQDQCHGIARLLAVSDGRHTRLSLQEGLGAEKWSQIADYFPGESGRAGPRSPFAEQRLQDKRHVGRPLSEPAHEIGKPFAAERDVDTHAIAARRKCGL